MRAKRKMRKRTKVILIIILSVTVFGLGVGTFVFNKISKSMVLQPVGNINLQQVKDGTYNGTAKNEIIIVEVEVSVKNGNISKINILKHDNGFGEKAETITEEIIRKQSLDVDAISGATYSSNIILKAVENALMNGVNE